MMNDILLNSALVYRDLMNVKYHVMIARKQKLVPLTISFPVEGYYHLAGFQYAGINQLKNRKNALDKILTETVTSVHLRSADAYDYIENRLIAIAMLPELLENGRIIFHYRGHEQRWSDIRADYVASMNIGSSNMFFFTAEDSNTEQVPVSIFLRDDNDYTQFCPGYKVLLVEKENVSDGIREFVFRSPSYYEK